MSNGTDTDLTTSQVKLLDVGGQFSCSLCSGLCRSLIGLFVGSGLCRRALFASSFLELLYRFRSVCPC